MGRYSSYVFGTALFAIVGFLFAFTVGKHNLGLEQSAAIVVSVPFGLAAGLCALVLEYRSRQKPSLRKRQEVIPIYQE